MISKFRRLFTVRSLHTQLPHLVYTYSHDDMILNIKLNRPERLNAMSFEMSASIQQLCNSLNTKTRCVVITGTADSFSTGRDLKLSRSFSDEETELYLKACIDSCLAVKSLKIPTVCAINGAAFGWGLELALCCDLRVTREDVVLCFPETSLGLFPGASGTVTLSRLIGDSFAKELIFTAKRFKGVEAFRMGLVNEVIKGNSEDVKASALVLAEKIIKNGPLGVKGAKKVINESDKTFKEQLEISNQERFKLNNSEDYKEGLLAFQQKRLPKFNGK